MMCVGGGVVKKTGKKNPAERVWFGAKRGGSSVSLTAQIWSSTTTSKGIAPYEDERAGMKRSFCAEPWSDFLSLTQSPEQMFPAVSTAPPHPLVTPSVPRPQPRSLPPGLASQGRSWSQGFQKAEASRCHGHSNVHPSTLECTRGPCARAWTSPLRTRVNLLRSTCNSSSQHQLPRMHAGGRARPCGLPWSPDQEMPRVLVSFPPLFPSTL